MTQTLCCEEDGTFYIKLDSHKLKLEVEELSGKFLERAQLELREIDEIKTKSIEILRTLLENEPNLEIPTDENDFLLKFLRPCKFYPDSAFKLMRKYYRFKYKHPNYSHNLVPSALQKVIKHQITNFLPERDKNGCRIIIIQIGAKWDPKIFNLTDLMRSVMLFIEIGMAEPKTQLGGVQVIFDMNRLSLYQVCQFGPSFAKTLVEWVQECVPLRLKGIHIVHEPRVFSLLYTVFKPFLNEKLRKRIIFHGKNMSKLIDSIGAEALPLNYGGTMDIPETPGDLLVELLTLYEEDFKKADEIGYVKEKVINISEST